MRYILDTRYTLGTRGDIPYRHVAWSLSTSACLQQEAISQLLKLLPMEEVKRRLKKLQKETAKEEKLGAMLKETGILYIDILYCYTCSTVK